MDHFVSLDEATHCCFGLGRFFMSVRAILAVSLLRLCSV